MILNIEVSIINKILINRYLKTAQYNNKIFKKKNILRFMGLFSLFKNKKKQNSPNITNKTKEETILVKMGQKNKRKLLELAGYEESIGEFEKALEHYKMLGDNNSEIRLKEKMAKKKKDEILNKREEIKKRRASGKMYERNDFLRYAEILVGSTWENNKGLNEIRLDDFRRAIQFFKEFEEYNDFVGELWLEQAKKDANSLNFNLAIEDLRKALETKSEFLKKEEIEQMIDLYSKKAELKEKLNFTWA